MLDRIKPFVLVVALLSSLALLAIGAPSCGPVILSDPPDIVSLNIESTNVTAGLTISMSVEAVGVGTLLYAWEATRDDGVEDVGAFTQSDTPETSWTAPFEEGLVVITVTVTDARGTSSLGVDVLVGPGLDGDGDGFSVAEGDCDDEDPGIFPGAPEGQDGQDNDCDGQIDEGSEDVDDDGDGFTDIQGDCDDSDASVYPGADELVNGIDENCNTLIDDHTDAYDDDGDGFSEDEGDCNDGNASIHPAADELLDDVDNDCDEVIDEHTVGYDDDGDGYTELEGDCDDGDADTWPGAVELPDGEDNDCNGQIDDGSFITDDDGDGFTDLAGDCDDTNPYTYPGAPEYLDGYDNNCNGLFDEGMDLDDGDGDGWSEADGDCNDGNDQIYPGALELDDGIDNDCDGFGYSNPPTAIGAVLGEPQSCAPVILTAQSSFDPDGDTLDFTWFFTTMPPLSQLTDDDIEGRFEMEASFVPDSAGYWAVALQVSDGTYTSAPATVGFTVAERPSNTPPAAAFVGGNLNDTMNTSCSTDSYGNCSGCNPCEPTYIVDATATIDADGDPLWFVWEADKVSGDGGPPTVTDNGNGTATLTFSMTVSCANTSTGLYEVDVEVHDCNGATDSATLQINYTCNG